MAIKYITDVAIEGKKVLLRVDYNVPYDKDMNITDDTRIKATLPTIKYCIEKKCTIILVSHMGRPKGTIVPEMSLKPVAQRLAELIQTDVSFIDTPVGSALQDDIQNLATGSIVLLENIRFYPGEEKNDHELGKQLAMLCDIYINDAFAAAHRGHASNEAITHYVDQCCAGFLLENEIEFFNKAMINPERPLCAIIGGAKVSTKLDVLMNILNKVDSIIIGGAMAFTFLKSQGLETGNSLLEEDLVENAASILKKAKEKNINVLLPVDAVIAQEFSNDSPNVIVPIDAIPEGQIGLDIGPDSIKKFNEVINNAKTVLWNGPMGAFEMPNFSKGTFSIAQTLAESSCLSIIGGGDSVTAVNQAGVAEKMSYISTGGGAFLELLEGKTLPAIAALDKY